jgi:hypothetical protein
MVELFKMSIRKNMIRVATRKMMLDECSRECTVTFIRAAFVADSTWSNSSTNTGSNNSSKSSNGSNSSTNNGSKNSSKSSNGSNSRTNNGSNNSSKSSYGSNSRTGRKERRYFRNLYGRKKETGRKRKRSTIRRRDRAAALHATAGKKQSVVASSQFSGVEFHARELESLSARDVAQTKRKGRVGRGVGTRFNLTRISHLQSLLASIGGMESEQVCHAFCLSLSYYPLILLPLSHSPLIIPLSHSPPPHTFFFLSF